MTFIKNSLLNVFMYGSGLIIINGLSFLLLPFYTRMFPPQEYALIVLVLVCIPFSRYVLPLEIVQAVPVFASDNENQRELYISTGFWFICCMSCVCYPFVFILNSYIQLMTVANEKVFIILSLLAIDCLFYYCSNILRWQLKPFLYNCITISAAILEAGLSIVFILKFNFGWICVFYAWLVSRFLGLVVILIITREFYSFQFNFKILKSLLSFSLPLMFGNIAYNINRSLDRWIIAKFLGLAIVGIYGAGATIGGFINLIIASLSAALTPLIYKNHDRKEAPVEIVSLFYIVISLCMLIAISFTLFL